MSHENDRGQNAVIGADGYQEATIVVKSGFKPDNVRVIHGKPVRLTFRRDEQGGCAYSVKLPDFNRDVTLPSGKSVPVEFVPDKAGTFPFSCGMGMFSGQIVVE